MQVKIRNPLLITNEKADELKALESILENFELTTVIGVGGKKIDVSIKSLDANEAIVSGDCDGDIDCLQLLGEIILSSIIGVRDGETLEPKLIKASGKIGVDRVMDVATNSIVWYIEMHKGLGEYYTTAKIYRECVRLVIDKRVRGHPLARMVADALVRNRVATIATRRAALVISLVYGDISEHAWRLFTAAVRLEDGVIVSTSEEDVAGVLAELLKEREYIDVPQPPAARGIYNIIPFNVKEVKPEYRKRITRGISLLYSVLGAKEYLSDKPAVYRGVFYVADANAEIMARVSRAINPVEEVLDSDTVYYGRIVTVDDAVMKMLELLLDIAEEVKKGGVVRLSSELSDITPMLKWYMDQFDASTLPLRSMSWKDTLRWLWWKLGRGEAMVKISKEHLERLVKRRLIDYEAPLTDIAGLILILHALQQNQG